MPTTPPQRAHSRITKSGPEPTFNENIIACKPTLRPKPNTHDTSRQVIILRIEGGPMTNRVPPVTKSVTSVNSIS